MRKFAAAILALGLVGTSATALAQEHGSYSDRVHTVRLNRYFWNQSGPRPQPKADQFCNGGALIRNRSYRGSDVALTALTLGFYSPQHVTFSCARSSS